MSNLSRIRLIESLRSGGDSIAVYAPAGWGKSVLLEAAARSDLRLVPVSLGATEGHPALFVDALSQGLRKAYPGAAVGAVRAAAGLRSGDNPVEVFQRIREALGADQLVIGFDEAERLPRGPVWDLVRRVVTERVSGFRVVLTARVPQPELMPEPTSLVGPAALGFNLGEIEQLLAAESDSARPESKPDLKAAGGGTSLRALARRLDSETGGWPAIVAARIRASGALEVPKAELARVFAPIVDEALSHERSEARYTLQIASVVSSFSRSFIQALVTGDVPGSADARRRLIRLEPTIISKSLEDLVKSGLLVEGAGDPSVFTVPAGARVVLSERFREKDHAGWLEANRRAGELLIARDKNPGPELVDLFAASGERERLVDILSKHGPRLELELADRGEDDRLLGWAATFESDPNPPFWVDIIAGLAHARRAEVDAARTCLDRAREKLAFEKRENVLWRWQPRLAEAQALSARARGDYVDARSFLQRGLDQAGQSSRRGLAQGENQRELDALELRMTIMLARISRESASWEKAREAQALARSLLKTRLASDGANARLAATLLEFELHMLLYAASAGDKTQLEELSLSGTAGIAAVARPLVGLLKTGDLTACLDSLRELRKAARDGAEPNPNGATAGSAASNAAFLASLLIARLAQSSDEVSDSLDKILEASDVVAELVSAEAVLRKKRTSLADATGHLEGWSQALTLELAAVGPGRALDQARDAYRRVGARFDEVRLWLVSGAAAARRVDDGDGETDAVVKAVESIVEVSQAGHFAVPWSFAGRGEVDPERRIRTLWIAGLRHGNDKTREVCKVELEKLGVDTRAVTGPKERPRTPSGLSRRPAIVHGAPFVLHTRTSSQGLSGSDYQQLIATKGPGSFVVCVPDQLVLNFGRVVSLGQKRVMMPLLLHLLRNPDTSFSMLELAREVWDSPELTPTVQTKVKVAISRLRALLGKNRNYITTTRKQEGAESVVAYQVAPQLQFQIVEQAV